MSDLYSGYSELKIFYHTDKIKDIINKKRTAPIYLRIKPTNICNQNCHYCCYNNDKIVEDRIINRTDSIPWEKMKEIINDIADMGVKAITFSGGGEPLCYKYINESIDLLYNKNIEFAIITNGQNLNGDVAKRLTNAKWIRISLDSANEKTYENIRGVRTFSTVIDNIKEFCKMKNDDCEVGINFVVTKDNFEQIYDLCKLAEGIGVNNIKFSPLILKYNTQEYHENIKKQVSEQLKQAEKDLVSVDFKIINKYDNDLNLEVKFKRSYDVCYTKEIFAVIAADCKVYVCHQKAYLEDGMVGDLAERSFKEIWFSQETIDKLSTYNCKERCSNISCAFDERNKLLNTLVNMNKKHINFI